MRKFLPLLLCLFYCGSLVPANAQLTRSQARDAEWKSYVLPKTNFARQTSTGKDFVFRVPVDWKQEGTDLTFAGPHSTKLLINVQKIPDGYPLEEYFGAFLRNVRDVPGAADSLLTRRTRLQDLEAREVVYQSLDAEGELTRSTIWITVRGPLAISFTFIAPVAHVTEMEPFFKAVVQSTMFVSGDYRVLKNLRETEAKSPEAGPINELQTLVASLVEVTPNREAAITRLTSLFSSTPTVAGDLLLDRRPFVRAAAVEALARSNNSTVSDFLWDAINDREPLVAEAAARAVAKTPDAVAKIMESISGFDTGTMARVWPFMTKETRNELVQIIFKETAVRRPPRPPVPKTRQKSEVSVTVSELIPVQPGKTITITGAVAEIARDPNVQIGALMLLSTVPPDELKLPLARIMAANYDPLIIVGLQVANARGESLPVSELLKLVQSSDQQVSKLAAQNLGLSANITDIPALEALISKDGSKKTLDDELKLTITKIRFRNELSSAKTTSQARELIGKAESEASLADFAWRYDCEATVSGCAPGKNSLKRDLAVKPFAENLFPRKLRHYTAIPNPGQAIQNFYQTLHGLQMDSPRAQSSLVFMMGNVRQLLGQELSAPPDSEALIDSTGIDPNSPIAFGTWTADSASDSNAGAQRRAIVLRVKDRARFERVVERFQVLAGAFTNLTEYVAIGTRAFAALPALLPFTAKAVLEVDQSKTSSRSVGTHSIVGEKDWNGLRIKTIEHTWLNSEWQVESAATHLLYLGDTAVLAPDLATLRELLVNASASDRQFLAHNPEFRRAIERNGDVVYFSDLKAVMAHAGEANKETSSKINESGALKFAGSLWENSHHINFDESDWSKPLLPFHPKELSAPRELLPASTIAYYLMKVDLAAAGSSSWKALFSASESEAVSNVWALDFKKDVLPELGPECGVVMLDLPDLNELKGEKWAVFCKLKSDKLADALIAGKLFRGVGPTTDVAELKAGADSYFVATRSGFLVVANTAKALAAFDRKTNLAATRDYSRAVERVPNGIVAFGGYNLEAAIAAATDPTADDQRSRIANVIFSLASAFHSQNFYATASAGTVEARSSVAMDREGRYPLADVSYLPRGTNITLAVVEPSGVPITDQRRLGSLVLRVKAKAVGAIDNIKDDVKSAEQTVEQKSPTELVLTVAARRGGVEKSVQLPVQNPELAPYLKLGEEFAAADKRISDQAREIAGNDRDAWSVARKLADWTHQNLEWKLTLSANPLQTLATREADCSEFSELFVAMARSLGLPARIVSGLAYSGTSFGGHAWVEVWVGKWVELDPTWGTSFADATHIRSSTNALLTTAALNLIEFEVLEARRTVADFQKSPRALTEHLMKAIPAGDRADVEAAIDPATLTDQFMGAGAWAKLNDSERDEMWSGYRRVLNEIIYGYGKAEAKFSNMRLMHLEEKGDTAEAICLLAPSEELLKLRFVRRNDVWSLVEVVQNDSALYVVSETLQPTIVRIEKARAGEKSPSFALSDFVRVLLLLNNDAAKGVAVVDGLLKAKPKDQGLRFLKALALLRIEKREDEGQKLLTELANESFAPAIYRLASETRYLEDENARKRIVELYERYVSLEPYDARGFRALARAHQYIENHDKAEAAYRKTLELDPNDTSHYLDLMEFLVLHDRLAEVRPWLIAADKIKTPEEDIFASVLEDLYVEDVKYAEQLAASEPSRMKTSARANLALGRAYSSEKHYVQALRFLNAAAQLDKTSAEPHHSMAHVYRQQSRWLTALRAADQSLALDPEDSEAHYERACALARLGRIKEAAAALTKAIELDPGQVDYVVDEPDLKRVISLPSIKKLLAPPEKQ